jgi:hypothetical protein
MNLRTWRRKPRSASNDASPSSALGIALPHPVVVDTNVFAIADGLHAAASAGCVDACLQLVVQLESGLPLLVDEGDEIFVEYLGTLDAFRSAGLAAKLVSRLYRTRHGGSCRRVAINKSDTPPPSYDEVPAALHDFDADDQKFIAVAATTNGRSLLFAGMDGEWLDRSADFAASGLLLQFPCFADLAGRA